MKKVSVILLTCCLLFALVACVEKNGEALPDQTTATTFTTASTVTTTVATVISEKTDAAGVLHKNIHLEGEKAENFELPLRGATGFVSYPISLHTAANTDSKVLKNLKPGDAFTVWSEKGDWWRVTTADGKKGYVQHVTCYLNIPDVIPSVVIENTNSTASAFLSSGESIPEITGKKLYNSLYQNARFGEKRHILAANYIMVKKIYAAQQAALQDGYTLVINETFRPFDVQLKISAELADLRLKNSKVRAGIDQSPWGIGWFISNRLSTHQMGCAMDVSLAKVSTVTWERCGEYLYPTVTAYKACKMPTPIHELSVAAVSLKSPVNSYSPTEWQYVASADSMTKSALRLKKYCTQAGMSPLASEWWHFNDLEAKQAIGDRCVSDVFYLDTCVSKIPD